MGAQIAVRHPFFNQEQTEIILHLADGMTDVEIARAMGKTPDAVATMISRMYAKVAARNRANLIHLCHQMNILK